MMRSLKASSTLRNCASFLPVVIIIACSLLAGKGDAFATEPTLRPPSSSSSAARAASARCRRVDIRRLPEELSFGLPTTTRGNGSFLRRLAAESDDDDGGAPFSSSDGAPLAAGLAGAVLASTAAVLLRTLSARPVAEFDVDLYMALDRVLGAPPAPAEGEIVDLPPLGPAEQLVGALFGPPSNRW